MLLSFSFVLSVSPEGFVVVSTAFVVASPLKNGVAGGRVEGSVAGGGVVSGLCSSIGTGGGPIVADGILGGVERVVGLAVIFGDVEMGVIFGV